MTAIIERHGTIAVVKIDHPPVNALSQAVRQALWDAVEKIDADEELTAAILVGGGRTFIAGADVKEFDRPLQSPHLPDLVARIEGARKPWIAAIHGSALGGGFEVALGCRFRVATATARIGLPEVTLGLVPGAGGSVRLIRLTTAPVAVEMVTGGKPIPASEAKALGLVDEILDGDLVRAVLAFADKAVRMPLPLRVCERAVGPIERGFWDEAQRKVSAAAKGEIAPAKALACLRLAAEADFNRALAFERETFLELRGSDQAKALRHVFFAERAAMRPAEIAGAAPRAIRTAAVVGGGTMGAGIAAALRDADIPIVLVERDQPALEKGLASIGKIFEAAAKRGRISAEAAVGRLAGVESATDYGALSDVDLVIEAVFEDLDVKRGVFANLNKVCRPDAILSTNTSYLNPSEIAEGISQPERFLGLHFFSPANVMKLVEIVPTAATAPDVVAAGFVLARALGKIPVRAGICDGFIGNRILKTMREQSERVLLSGASPSEVDAAMRAFGMPMGPFEAQDLGGLDIAHHQRSAARARGELPFAPVAERLCALGRYGQKTGGGWYDYEPGSRKPLPANVVNGIAAEEASKANVRRKAMSSNDISDGILLPMVNEAAAILGNGIAARSDDIDLVEIHGYGFPRWRGGLMYYAQARGLAAIVEVLKFLHQSGMAKPPCSRLLEAASIGRFDR